MFEHLNPGVILRWKYERLQISSFFLQNYTFYINFTDYLAIIRIRIKLIISLNAKNIFTCSKSFEIMWGKTKYLINPGSWIMNRIVFSSWPGSSCLYNKSSLRSSIIFLIRNVWCWIEIEGENWDIKSIPAWKR